MPLGLMISLGGSPEPLAKAIGEHLPQVVCYFASQRSVVELGTVHRLLAEKGITVSDFKVVLVDDVNDLIHCFGKALECAKVFEQKGIPPNDVVVDYTGGTKTMTAAMALAGVRNGFSFSYVGGTERTKAGVGTVVDGHEVVYTGISPWQIFAVEEWQRLVLLVSHYHYEAAVALTQEIVPRQPAGELLVWQGLHLTLEGLLLWDQFNHKAAIPQLTYGIRKLETWVEIKKDERLAPFAGQAQESLAFLRDCTKTQRDFRSFLRHFWWISSPTRTEGPLKAGTMMPRRGSIGPWR